MTQKTTPAAKALKKRNKKIIDLFHEHFEELYDENCKSGKYGRLITFISEKTPTSQATVRRVLQANGLISTVNQMNA